MESATLDVMREFIYWVISNFSSVIEYTYTLLVGFVAIGVPLSIQISGQHADKYNNSLLAERLVRGRVVTIPRVIFLSVFYLISSLVYLQALNENGGDFVIPENIKFTFELSLFFIFFTILTFTSWFYYRFYRRSIEQSESFITEYLGITKSKKSTYLLKFQNILKFIRFLLNEKAPQITEKLINILDSINLKLDKVINKIDLDRDGKRFNEEKKKEFEAGLEVLIEHLTEKGWEVKFHSIFSRLKIKIKRAYFTENTLELSENDIEIIKIYWDFLIRVIRNARKSENTKLSFGGQRGLFGLIEKIMFHPQYEKIVTEPYEQGESKKVVWVSDIYEIARWQAQQKTSGIDLFLEGEWLHSIFNLSSTFDFSKGTDGYKRILSLAVDIFEILLKDKPSVINKFIDSASWGIPSSNSKEHYYFWAPNDKKWVYDFWGEFNKLDFDLNNIQQISNAIHSLRNGEAFNRYCKSPECLPLSQEDIDRIDMELDGLFLSIHQQAMKSLGIRLSTKISYFERWKEFYGCLEAIQPRESKSLNLNETILTKSSNEVLSLMIVNNRVSHELIRFGDKRDAEVFFFRACFFQLCFHTERGDNEPLNFPSLEQKQYDLKMTLLNGLLEQERYIRNLGIWYREVTLVREKLKSARDRITSEKINSYKTCKLVSLDEFQVALSHGWQEYQRVFELLGIEFTKEIYSQPLKTKFELKRIDLSVQKFFEPLVQKEGSFIAKQFLICCLLTKILQVAQNNEIEVTKLNQHLIFAPSHFLVKHGFKRDKHCWCHLDLPNTIALASEANTVIAIKKNALKLYVSDDARVAEHAPFFIDYKDTNDDSICINSAIYFNLKVKNELEVKIMKLY
ncbi:hypothetical protein [Pseudoalteromonas spongiae]|uniref:hypothetical protein n=1 Tax=Pseudoalteromonas spongiae TaxID=298657 RepID=UPI000C2CE41D|nr:hypothetical protein [Pseudoalteromonas spongiae]